MWEVAAHGKCLIYVFTSFMDQPRAKYAFIFRFLSFMYFGIDWNRISIPKTSILDSNGIDLDSKNLDSRFHGIDLDSKILDSDSSGIDLDSDYRSIPIPGIAQP